VERSLDVAQSNRRHVGPAQPRSMPGASRSLKPGASRPPSAAATASVRIGDASGMLGLKRSLLRDCDKRPGIREISPAFRAT